MEVENYWWEGLVHDALSSYASDDYTDNTDSIILLIAKILEAEKQNYGKD